MLQSPPILAVEVVSPESVKRDKEKKPQEYAALKIPECCLVDPIQNQVTVLTLVDKQYEATDFSGNQLIASQVFPEQPLPSKYCQLKKRRARRNSLLS